MSIRVNSINLCRSCKHAVKNFQLYEKYENVDIIPKGCAYLYRSKNIDYIHYTCNDLYIVSIICRPNRRRIVHYLTCTPCLNLLIEAVTDVYGSQTFKNMCGCCQFEN